MSPCSILCDFGFSVSCAEKQPSRRDREHCMQNIIWQIIMMPDTGLRMQIQQKHHDHAWDLLFTAHRRRGWWYRKHESETHSCHCHCGILPCTRTSVHASMQPCPCIALCGPPTHPLRISSMDTPTRPPARPMVNMPVPEYRTSGGETLQALRSCRWALADSATTTTHLTCLS